MFTGLVVEKGTVKRAKVRRGVLDLEVHAPRVARKLRRGDSVAVDGVCLTATEVSRRRFSAEAMAETLVRTTLSDVGKGGEVNLELPARAGDRLGGHLVQGHIDGVAKVLRIERDEGAHRVWLTASDDILRYLAPKGSVTLDGASLTVVEVDSTSFQVALIPHTLESTTLGALAVDSRVNVEVDVLAKYVERLLNSDERK